jgi:hypothetical protein
MSYFQTLHTKYINKPFFTICYKNITIILFFLFFILSLLHLLTCVYIFLIILGKQDSNAFLNFITIFFFSFGNYLNLVGSLLLTCESSFNSFFSQDFVTTDSLVPFTNEVTTFGNCIGP